jgi:subtilisin family serine protease
MAIRWKILPRGAATDANGGDVKGFLALPFVALRSSSTRDDTIAEYSDDHVWLLAGLDWLLSRRLDVVNLSIGPPPTDFNRNDPLHVATRLLVEQGTTVVVAAGNDGPRLDSLAQLARAPWVIAVGAVDDGRRLLDDSSRGTADGPKPSIVADGRDLVDKPFPPGTSFASPRVAVIAAWLISCLRLAASDSAASLSESLTDPLPFPTVGFADTGATDVINHAGSPLARQFLDQGETAVRLARDPREQKWYEIVASAARSSDLPITLKSMPELVRRALQRMAVPIEGEPPQAVGSGYVSPELCEEFLAKLTPTRYLGMLTDAPIEVPELDRRLGPLWDAPKIATLRELFFCGIRPYVTKVL